MINSKMVTELVDTGLYSTLMHLFELGGSLPNWLIVKDPDLVNENFTLEDFYYLAENTEDVKQLNAIALFIMESGYAHPLFVSRCCKLLATKFKQNVFIEAMLFKSSVIKDDYKSIFKNTLETIARDTLLESLIALYALGYNVDKDTHKRLVASACCTLRKKPSTVQDIVLYRQLQNYAYFTDFPILTALCFYSRGIPKQRSKNFSVFLDYGFTYVEQTMLAFQLQKDCVNPNTNYYNDLCLVTLNALSMLNHEWTEDEKLCIQDLCAYSHEKGYLVHAKNLLWCKENKLLNHFSTSVGIKSIQNQVVGLQSSTAFELLKKTSLSLEGSDLIAAYQRHPEVYQLIFKFFRKECISLYETLIQVDKSLSKFIEYYANHLSSFIDRESYDLMLILRENRSSLAYQLLMRNAKSSMKLLTKDENKILYDEVKVYKSLYS